MLLRRFISNRNIHEWCEETVQDKPKIKKDRLHAIEQNLGDKKKVDLSHDEMEQAPWWWSHEEHPAGNGPFFSSLHMGHCNVMGEALSSVVIPKQAYWIGTCLQLKVMSGEPLLGMPHMLVVQIRYWNERKRQRAATCHTLYHKENDKTNQAPSVALLLHGRTEENNLLASAANITCPSLAVDDSIFYHKGSRKASASERILAELGTIQGPGPRGAFLLCRVSGILFIEENVLLPASLE